MSETRDISEARLGKVPAISPETTEPSLDFGALIDHDTEDFEFAPAPPLRSARRGWLPWLIGVLLVALIGGGIITYLNLRPKSSVTYTQATATVGNLTVTVSGTGPVQAGAVYNLNFGASAPIQAINVKVGQQVTQGQVLATIDPTSLQDAVNQAQNNVNSAQISLNSARVSLSSARNQGAVTIDNASITEQNQLNNCSANGTPNSSGNGTPPPTPDPATVARCQRQVRDQFAQAVDQANASVNNAQNQVASAQQQLINAQTSLQTAQNNLKNATLTAPANGVIESINGLVGEISGGGSSGGSSGGANSSSSSSGNSSAFMVLVDASTLNIAAQVNEANIATVAVNQPVQFTVAAYPSQTFRASVTGIDTLGQTSSGVVTYLVNLAVDMQSVGHAHIYPGMTATTNITTAERISTLLVPSTALSFSATALSNGELDRNSLRSLIGGARSASGGNRGIVVELKNGKLVPVLVTTGLTNGQETEILSGLNEGDQIVVSQTGGQTTPGGGNGGGGNGGGGGRGGGGIIIGGGR